MKEFRKIKTTTINDETYFEGEEIAKILGYKSPKRAIYNHVNDEDKIIKQNVALINEQGVNGLIVSSSSTAAATELKKWLTSKVAPSTQENITQTPIEIMLKVDQDGKTTAKALYEFLELNPAVYARWCKTNILKNSFAEENIDYEVFNINVENPLGGRPTTDYKLTASFAKKLAISSQTERGEQAREYFLKVEEKLKQTVTKKSPSDDKLELERQKLELQKTRAEAMALNAKNRAFKTLMQSIEKHKQLSPIAVEVFGLKALESAFGADVGNYLPQVEKTYSAKEVGEMLGISACKVGKLANLYSLKTEEYGKFVMDKSPYSSKEVESFRYNEKGIKTLRELAWVLLT